jgi:hypothetical protein
MYHRVRNSVFRFAFLLLLLHPLQGQNSWLRDAADGTRVIVDTGVTCDILPRHPVTIPLGTPILVVAEVKSDGATWYIGYPAMAPNSRCRFYGPSTAAWHKADPDSLLLAVLDHALARKDVTFEELVAAENYLTRSDARWRSEAGRAQIPGQLQFRWLQLISLAIGLDGFTSRASEPLVESWIVHHSELLEVYEPSGDWYVPTEYFWKIYDSNPAAPWAEELAWFVANLPVQHDECETTCILSGYIENRVLEYWTRFPSGAHIAEALASATESLRGLYAGPCGQEDVQLVAEIRNSLSKVTHPAKDQILRSLAEIEKACPK